MIYYFSFSLYVTAENSKYWIAGNLWVKIVEEKLSYFLTIIHKNSYTTRYIAETLGDSYTEWSKKKFKM